MEHPRLSQFGLLLQPHINSHKVTPMTKANTSACIHLIQQAASGNEKQLGCRAESHYSKQGNTEVNYRSWTFLFASIIMVPPWLDVAVLFALPLSSSMLLSFTLPNGLVHRHSATLITAHYSPTEILYSTMSNFKSLNRGEKCSWILFFFAWSGKMWVFSYSKWTVEHKWSRARVISHPTSSLQIRSTMTRDMGEVLQNFSPTVNTLYSLQIISHHNAMWRNV